MGLAKRPNPLVIGVSVAAVVLVAVTRLAPPLELGRDDTGATNVAVARANHALIAANMAASRIAADQGGAFTADAECRWEFVKYIPSSTETRWFKRLQADLQSACAMTTGDFRRELYDGVYQNKRSMTPDDLRHVKTLPTNCTGTLPDMDVLRKQKDIFSLFEFKNSCTNETHFSPIEPLAGPLRHPALCNQGRSDSDVIRKDWLVVDPWVAQQAEKTRAKKRYFDAGASTWLGDVSGASQAWFWAMYGQMCVQFDSFHCWEKKNHDATNFFSEIPAAVRPKYHFYNTPATTSAKDGNSPVFHLLSEATKDDFVVFKLDIDHTETEEKIVDSLLANPKALELIDEFFWEHHVKFQSMSFAWGWDANMQMQDATIKYLSAMRQVGVRAHSWV